MNRTLNEADDDFELPQRTADRRTNVREEVYRDERGHDRELTLSTGTVLGIFFALALICAVFFGFGYTMGRKSSQAAADTAAASSGSSDTASADTTASVSGPKPAAGSPAIQAIPGYMSQHEADAANRSAAAQGYKPTTTASSNNAGSTTVTLPMSGAATGSQTASSTRTAAASRVASTEVPLTAAGTPAPHNNSPSDPAKPSAVPVKPAINTAASTSAPSTASFNNAASTGAGNGPIYVQVAAVSHKEDAESLLAGLKQRGYSAFERSLDTDKLIHIQVGPFNTKQSADAMKARLQGSGYNAILK